MHVFFFWHPELYSLSVKEYHSSVRTSTHAYSGEFKKSNQFALKKILRHERSTSEQEQQFLWAA